MTIKQQVFKASTIREILPVVAMWAAMLFIYSMDAGHQLLRNSTALVVLVTTSWRVYIFLTRGRETYAINATGISISRWSDPIKWRDLRKVMTYPTPFGSYILFILKGGVRLNSNRHWPFNWIDTLNGGIGAGQVWFSTAIFIDKHEVILSSTFDAFCNAVPEAERTEKECYVANDQGEKP